MQHFWAIYVLPRIPFVQHSGKISIPKLQKWTEIGWTWFWIWFKMIKLTSKAVLTTNILPTNISSPQIFYRLSPWIYPCFSNRQKRPFLAKNSSLFFWVNTFLGSLSVAHWVHSVYFHEIDSKFAKPKMNEKWIRKIEGEFIVISLTRW